MQVTEAEEIYKLIQNKHSEWEAGKLPSMPTRPKSGQFTCCQFEPLSNLVDNSNEQCSGLDGTTKTHCSCVLQLADQRVLDGRDPGVVPTKSTT